jgi:hypothetical protein
MFGDSRDACRPPTAPLSRFGPCRLQVEIHSDCPFQSIEVNVLRDLRAIPQNAFQNRKNDGSGVQTVEGSTLKERKVPFPLDKTRKHTDNFAISNRIQNRLRGP